MQKTQSFGVLFLLVTTVDFTTGFLGMSMLSGCATICNPLPDTPLTFCTYRCSFLKFGSYFDGSGCWLWLGIGSLVRRAGICRNGFCRRNSNKNERSPATEHCGLHDGIPHLEQTTTQNSTEDVSDISDRSTVSSETKGHDASSPTYDRTSRSGTSEVRTRGSTYSLDGGSGGGCKGSDAAASTGGISDEVSYQTTTTTGFTPSTNRSEETPYTRGENISSTPKYEVSTPSSNLTSQTTKKRVCRKIIPTPPVPNCRMRCDYDEGTRLRKVEPNGTLCVIGRNKAVAKENSPARGGSALGKCYRGRCYTATELSGLETNNVLPKPSSIPRNRGSKAEGEQR